MASLPPRRENVMSMGRFRMSSWLCMFHFPKTVSDSDSETEKELSYSFLLPFRIVSFRFFWDHFLKFSLASAAAAAFNFVLGNLVPG